jgi:hypothetical protein
MWLLKMRGDGILSTSACVLGNVQELSIQCGYERRGLSSLSTPSCRIRYMIFASQVEPDLGNEQ